MTPRPIIIDCDPGVDDALALLLAMASPNELDLLGVTTVAGNAPLALTSRNALKVCALAGRDDIPVFAGCDRPSEREPSTAEHIHGETGLDGAELPAPASNLEDRHAVDFIIETVDARAGGVTLCPMGPLTNIALALNRHPPLARQVREIELMGGSAGSGNVTPYAEFNFHVDPHAAAKVMSCGAPLTMIGLDVTHRARLTSERLAAIEAIGTPISAAAAGLLRHYHGTNLAQPGGEGAPLHDPCVIATILRPDLFEGREAHVDIDLSDSPAVGQSIVDFSAPERQINARVVEEIDADGFFALLTERLASLSAAPEA